MQILGVSINSSSKVFSTKNDKTQSTTKSFGAYNHPARGKRKQAVNIERKMISVENVEDSGSGIGAMNNSPMSGSEEEEIHFVPEDNAKSWLDPYDGKYIATLELPAAKEKQYLKNKKRIDKLVEEEDESGMMPKDCYSFISLHGPNEPIFWVGILVFVFQFVFLLLALLSIVLPQWNTGKVDDNPWESRFADLFATEAGPILRCTQFWSLITSVVFVDSSVSDVITAINTAPNYKIATKHDKVGSMILSSLLRFIQGAFAVVVSVFLVFNSTNVIEVILNFTALNFISTLDNIFFDFSKTGKYG